MSRAVLASEHRYRLQREELNSFAAALAEEQLVLHFQPKVDMRRGEVLGLEALLRWQHPERGLLPPGRFLPSIQDTELDVRLGEWVLRRALHHLDEWTAGGDRLTVSVNISGNHLQQPDFIDRLRALLHDYPAISSNQLELEVLETSALDDVLLVSEVIQRGRALGVTFALDDFGTGYSSLTYLKRIPADVLKIDQSFVRDMLDDPEDFAIVEGTIGLAHAFRRKVIAEGIESAAHGNVLLRLGCDLGQGYGIARPMPAEQVPVWVETYEQPSEWARATATEWSAHDPQLNSAEIDHRRWVDDLVVSLTGSHSRLLKTLDLDSNRGRFSAWCNGTGRELYGHLPEYQELEALNGEIQRLGAELLGVKESGENEQLNAGITAIQELGAKAQRRLLALRAAVIKLPSAAGGDNEEVLGPR